MNGKDCLLAFAGLDETCLAAANDTETVRRGFLRQKKRRLRLLGAVCVCIAVAAAAAALNTQGRLRRTPAVTPPEAGPADRTTAGPSRAEPPLTLAGAAPSETQTPPSAAEKTDAAAQTASVPPQTQGEPAQSPAPPTNPSSESAFEKAYRYALNDPAYAAYLPGRVIAPEKVGEKLGETSATAGWQYADGAVPETEELRCEIYRVAGVDPETAVCVRFLDKGEALTTEHYYVQLNPLADLSAVSDYVIPRAEPGGEE